jgi:hypothetical protein
MESGLKLELITCISYCKYCTYMSSLYDLWWFNENTDIYTGLQKGAVAGTFTRLKWSLVPPDFKGCCIRYSLKLLQSWFNVPPVNSEVQVMADLKNIKSLVYIRKQDI